MVCIYIFVCLGGQDYTPVNSSITFSESKTFEQVSISTNSDDSLEQAESFKVQVTYDHDDASVLLLPAQSTIVITDNNSELYSTSDLCKLGFSTTISTVFYTRHIYIYYKCVDIELIIHILCTKILESALFYSLVIFSHILHANINMIQVFI